MMPFMSRKRLLQQRKASAHTSEWVWATTAFFSVSRSHGHALELHFIGIRLRRVNRDLLAVCGPRCAVFGAVQDDFRVFRRQPLEEGGHTHGDCATTSVCARAMPMSESAGTYTSVTLWAKVTKVFRARLLCRINVSEVTLGESWVETVAVTVLLRHASSSAHAMWLSRPTEHEAQLRMLFCLTYPTLTSPLPRGPPRRHLRRRGLTPRTGHGAAQAAKRRRRPHCTRARRGSARPPRRRSL